VGYFGVKSTKVCRAQMAATKPAKVGRLGPRCAKVRRGPQPAPTGASAKRSLQSTPRVKLLKSAPRGGPNSPKLLKSKVGPSPGEAGSNLLKSDRRRRLTKRSSLHEKRSSLRGRTKVAKVGPLRARGSNLLKSPTDRLRLVPPGGSVHVPRHTARASWLSLGSCCQYTLRRLSI
jgi:hypothetical protein